MDLDDSPSDVSRRSVLKASGGAVGLSTVGNARTIGGGRPFAGDRCPEATTEPSMEHCETASVEACADDHPATEALRDDVRASLERYYPTVGALIDQGFVPYFDLVASGDDDWSHWLNPEFIRDDTVVDPSRPESVLVDNRWWRPIGVMFIATRDGEPVDDPPAVYDVAERERCAPWHYHVGLPGRYAWWKYQQVYVNSLVDLSLQLPCRTPCMMHVWTFPNPNGVYAHDAPPPESRGGPPAEDPGFDTAAVPGEDKLGWDALPDGLKTLADAGSWLR
jgi:hypothetical protein